MSNGSFPNLKRPRSTSIPPSPSSSSSPKRAASEDPFPSSSDSGRGNDFLSANTQGKDAGSSPLRLDFDDEPDHGEGGWVRRTEEVHLNSDGVPGGKETLVRQYNELLGCLPPPYSLWERYYIVPVSLLNSLKTLALDDPSSSKSGAAVSDLRINLSLLLKEEQGEEVYVIEAAGPVGQAHLSVRGKQERIWNIKDGLMENEDFVFVSAEGWQKLVSWYGPYDGPSLSRFCMPGERIQMVPPIYTLYLVKPTGELNPVSSTNPPTTESPTSHPIRLSCPSDATELTLLDFMTWLVGDELGNSPMRFWTIDGSNPSSDASTLPALKALHLPPTLLPSLSGRLIEPNQNLTCAEAGFDNGDVLAIEIGKKTPLGVVWSVDVNEQGKAVEKVVSVPTAPAPLFSKPAFFPGSGNATASTSNLAPAGMQTRSQARGGSRKGKGLVGLVNLGNTCFMNSAVQCLSNTQELCEYFLSGVYREELNPDNPLGMHGQIAETFGGTVETLWAASSSHSSYSPRPLKVTTSRFAPQFAGYGQHDTQEFIAFLLDGLHEDLNRIKKKPYIEKPDWKPGGGDIELAELGRECWEGYKKRNDSVIVDLFQGQLRSTLVCPECHKESITMDPFMYLTVPLPISQHRQIRLHYISRDPEKPPLRVHLLIPQNASFMQVKEKLGALVKCNPSYLLGFDLWKGGVYAWWSDADHNSEAKDSDVIVFHELAAPVSASRKAVGTTSTDGSVTIPVYTFRSIEPGRTTYRNEPSDCALQPFFITLSKSEASDPVAVREAITRGYQRFIRSDMKSQLWVPSGSSKAADILPQTDGNDSVTEIHLDGEQTRVVEVPARTADGNMDVDSKTANAARSNGSSTSLSTLGSGKSGKLVPRSDLFKVHVADASTADGGTGMTVFKTKDNVVPLYRGSISSASAQWSSLENRRKAKKNMFGHIATGIKSFVGSYGSDEEGSPPNTPSAPPLVVRPGEGIFCEWQTKHFLDYFDSASVEEEVVDPAIAKELAKKKEGRAISIEDCLDEFSKEETLGQDDLWYCPQCKKHQAATKKLEIYKAPDILVICIKRFGSSRRLSDKLDNLVNFPIDGLDLEERIGERKVARSLKLSDDDAAKYGIEKGDEPMMYDLYAVDNHFGGMGGGHYTAFCRNKEDGEWYNYDDSRVSKANVEAVQSRAAYLLFYRRRTKRPIGGISRIKAEEASRAASPIPPSPQAGPSTLPVPDDSSPSSSSPNSDRLPSYSSSTPPSPVLSAAPDSDYELEAARIRNVRNLSNNIGYGNTAWGASSTMPGTMPGVHHAFGANTPPDTLSDLGNSTLRPMGMPSPPDSEDGFERIRAQPGVNGGTTEMSGLGEDYQVVRPGSGSEDAEMVSAPGSPDSRL